MFTKITKKAAIEFLKNCENLMIFADCNLLEQGYKKCFEYLSSAKYEVENGRKCIKASSNSLTFNTGSKLYFDDKATYYKNSNNIILKCVSDYDSFFEVTKYGVIAYAIK